MAKQIGSRKGMALFIKYIADYIDEEQVRGNDDLDGIIENGIDAFEGGGHDDVSSDYVVQVVAVPFFSSRYQRLAEGD